MLILKWNRTYLTIEQSFYFFYDSCEEISSSKGFVKTASTGRHKGMITEYIKHNLFHQGRLGRSVDMQDTHIVSLKPLRDFLIMNTLSQ